MQIPLKQKFKVSEYIKDYDEDSIVFFEGLCPCCQNPDCKSTDWGCYYRNSFDEFSNLIRIPIKRKLCNYLSEKQKRLVTFSFPPLFVVPYVKYSLNIICICMMLWLRYSGNINKALDDLMINHNPAGTLDNISEQQIRNFLSIFKSSFTKYLNYRYRRHSIDSNNDKSFCSYIRLCSTENIFTLLLKYFKSFSGSFKNIQFLFGTASQFR